MLLRALCHLGAIFLCFSLAFAGAEADEKGANATVAPESCVTTHHTLKTDSGSFSYTVKTGIATVTVPGRDTQASMFHVTYTKDNAEKTNRPITFAFNGGPGSASIWLHMGALGPKRILFGKNGEIPKPPVPVVDNPLSWLEFTDLVFIDPVGTGYSRAKEKSDSKKEFWGVRQDVDSVGEFIRLLFSREKRWASPVFLAGESYGTFRAAGLAEFLTTRYGVNLSGLVLISPVLDFATLIYSDGNVWPTALGLPTFAATAWKLNRIAPEYKASDLKTVLEKAEEFALGKYLQTTAKGNVRTSKGNNEFFEELSAFTGLPVALLKRTGGVVEEWRFSKELLADRGLLVGRMDTLITAEDPDAGSPFPAFDPSLEPYLAPFTSAVNAHVRDELEFLSDLPYEPLNYQVNRSWDYSSGINGEMGFPDTTGALKSAMAINPHMQVFVACGLFDLATPYFAAMNSVDRMELTGTLRNNIHFSTYEGGHMMYLREKPLNKLFSDARMFYRNATGK